ncbi:MULTISPECIES: GNAT family N-acetyltransferase [Sutcliffiella]|uniref:N-acetyltransferase domain-containing protein n=1 Tax=Sutcliffiella cohnii TaxID=33932 RepID=A0A223KW15_9BACI|nr:MULTISPECIES: GNAT family N-acetyltransferase [Sutcliffiella]AST93564.1 hypothetical protein BC6307_20985 [Sutcliffiella cohnii]WBL14752.1 GNAT family N-acetyltransferase [Sutcliffiella sp. NC1]
MTLSLSSFQIDNFLLDNYRNEIIYHQGLTKILDGKVIPILNNDGLAFCYFGENGIFGQREAYLIVFINGNYSMKNIIQELSKALEQMHSISFSNEIEILFLEIYTDDKDLIEKLSEMKEFLDMSRYSIKIRKKITERTMPSNVILSEPYSIRRISNEDELLVEETIDLITKALINGYKLLTDKPVNLINVKENVEASYYPLITENRISLSALNKQELCGHATVEIDEVGEGPVHREANLLDIYIKQPFMNHGLSSYLLNQIEQICLQNDISFLNATVEENDDVKLQRLLSMLDDKGYYKRSVTYYKWNN